jgi:flagellar biosynthesis protein FliQ
MDDALINLASDCLIITLKIAAPVMLAGVLIGLVISVLQAATSLQDQTISTVPKLLVMLIATVLLLPWIILRLMDYAAELFTLTSL